MAGGATLEEQTLAFLDLRLRTHGRLCGSRGADCGVPTSDDEQCEAE